MLSLPAASVTVTFASVKSVDAPVIVIWVLLSIDLMAFVPLISVPPKLTAVAFPLSVNPVPVIIDVAPFFIYCVATFVTVGNVLSMVKVEPVPTFPAASVTTTEPFVTSVDPNVIVILVLVYVAEIPNVAKVLPPIVTVGSPPFVKPDPRISRSSPSLPSAFAFPPVSVIEDIDGFVLSMAMVTFVAVLVLPASSVTLIALVLTSPVPAVNVIFVSSMTRNDPTPVVALFIVRVAIGLAGEDKNPEPTMDAVDPFLIAVFGVTEVRTGDILSTVNVAPAVLEFPAMSVTMTIPV